MSKGLTGKQKLFVESYLANGFNATEAARAAGYKGSDETLAAVGYENLRKPQISAAVSERINEAAMSANEVLARLSAQARGSLLDVLNEAGEFDLKDARARGVDGLMKKLKVKKRTIPQRGKTEEGDPLPPEVEHEYEYEVYDAQAALVHLGKFHKLFIERHEHSNPDGTPLMKPVEDALLKIYSDAK